MAETAFILIVEDDPSRAEDMAKGLREQGHVCLVIQSGPEAIESISVRQPDVIVAEELLLGNGSSGLLRQARRLAPQAEIVLIAEDADPRHGAITTDESLRLFRRIPREAPADQMRAVIATAAEQATRNRHQRVLQEQVFYRVGGEVPITVDVRIISASNQDLRQLMARGRFRRDLFYRLCVVPIELPALRERRLDIPILVEIFLDRLRRLHGKSIHAVHPLVMDAFLGNLQEAIFKMNPDTTQVVTWNYVQFDDALRILYKD